MLEQNKTITMKTLKINKLILLLIGLVVFTGCVEDDDFNAPNTSIVEPIFEDTDVISQISSVAGELAQAQGFNEEDPTLDYTDENTTYAYIFNENNLYMEGYVISSDEGGNFFKELLIQDKPENPTIGIKVLIDVNPLFVRYEPGRKVYVKLNGLAVGITNGVLTLGAQNGNSVGRISTADENKVIKRSANLTTLVPLPMDFTDFNDAKTNLFIELQDVQFNRNQALGDSPLSYASEAFDEFDGERNLETCSNGSTRVFSTSTFADFKSLTLPSGRGRMKAILTKDFRGNTFNIVINTPEDINFDNAERCDPVEINCGLASSQSTINIFSDDFESQTPFSPVSGNGWTNYIEAGTKSWEAYTDSGSNASLGISVRIGSYQSGDVSSIAWLITPEIDLDAQTNETFVFKTSNSFDDGSELELLFSPDWDGDEATIETATWGIIPAATIVSDDDNFTAWINSGIVDLSCADGTIHIAFRYVGSGDSDFDGTFELDDISINGQ